MDDFRLDESAVRRLLERASTLALGCDAVDAVLSRAANGTRLEAEDIAVLWYARSVDTEAVVDLVRRARGERTRQLETFSPLYMTNTCDAACRMCGMRRDNDVLIRETAELDAVETQLGTLLERGMQGVALLTGEYAAARRPWAMRYVNTALRATQRLGFNHVLLNVGSIDEDELPVLLDGIARRPDGMLAPRLTMCTFQETYDRRTYGKFMGHDPENPRSDFDRRLTNFDRARRAGFRGANPGILLGLNPDVAFEMVAATLHVEHLLAAGMEEVYLSIPRLRRIAGGGAGRGVTDDDFVRLVALLALALSDAKLVLTTREPREIQQRAAALVSVLSAGSSAVTPYTDDGARFPLEASQFEVTDQRPFEAILREHLDAGVAIENFRDTGCP